MSNRISDSRQYVTIGFRNETDVTLKTVQTFSIREKFATPILGIRENKPVSFTDKTKIKADPFMHKVG